MELEEFIAALSACHFQTVSASAPRPSEGRHIVVSHSEYVDGGFSLTLSEAHPVIVNAVAYVVSGMGFEVQCRGYDPMMEAWPRRAASRNDQPE